MNIKNDWIYFGIAGFGVGVGVRSFVEWGFAFSAFVTLVAVAVSLVYIVNRKPLNLFAAIFVLGIAIGVVRFDIADLNQGSVYLNEQIGSEIMLEGIVIDEPDERETNTKLIILVSEDDYIERETRVLVTVERYPKHHYGDRLQFVGELEKPTAFESDNGKLFDYGAYLEKDGVFYLMFYPKIEQIGSREGSVIKQTLFDFKEALLSRVEQVVPEPQASLLGGLVVGAKQSLGERLLEDFRKTGIIHIVVLSGYNVTIVAEFIMRVLSFLPLAFTWSLGVGSIALFAIMTGAGATIVRASIMAILVIIARATGRTYQITRALMLAGFLMILQNPKILVFDSSFQLSFMATVGLIHLAPRIEKHFGWVPTRWQLREFATATIATQLFVLPLILYKMGELSVVALPVNLLVLPFIPLTMLAGFLTGILGFIHAALSLPFAYISTALLSYELKVVDLFSALPFASIHISGFPLVAVLLLYALYGVLIWHLSR